MLGIDTSAGRKTEKKRRRNRKTPEIDILISDIHAADDGIEMRKIRELYPDCVILFLSGYSDKEYLRSAISSTPFRIYRLPVSPEQVVSAVRREAVDYWPTCRIPPWLAAKIKEARLVRLLLCSPRPGKNRLTFSAEGLAALSSSFSFQTPAPCCCRVFSRRRRHTGRGS